jgi:hypothetical protein
MEILQLTCTRPSTLVKLPSFRAVMIRQHGSLTPLCFDPTMLHIHASDVLSWYWALKWW